MGGKPVKELNAGIIISAVAISAVMFGAGMFMGYWMNREKLSSLEGSIDSIVGDVQNFQLQFLSFDVLGANATCPLLESTLSEINKKSYDIGSKLTSLGTAGEIRDESEYIRTKVQYSRLLTSYWLLAEKLKSACKTNVNTVVYFYNKDCKLCDDQAFVLTYLKNKYGEKMLVFTLDADLDEPSVKTLKSYYSTTEYPALIINGKLRSGFLSQQELEGMLSLGVVVG